ncbi:guanylate kinase [Allobacillus halotolerans]|uniref:AAA family ATPase n=1 Tax=Allobacillus halotolerans TaxID=570278 RepID=A0ABS6GKZ6_9BACI|nr:AAA family ATPase [Allobacillus halotolerans]MBU6079761.1 AAA family ATPase [Allobacillus halotolerans]
MKTIIVIVGGSGSGKTTIAHQLETHGFERLITTTTRSMREGEVNHHDYHFVSKEEFKNLDKIEESEYAGNHYGLSANEVDTKLTQHHQLVICMDMNGARAMQRKYPEYTKVVFIRLTKELLVERLNRRGSSEEEIQSRLEEAKKKNEFGMPEQVDVVIENKDLNESVQTILQLTQKQKEKADR